MRMEITEEMVAAGAAVLERYPFNGEEPLNHPTAILVAREVLTAALLKAAAEIEALRKQVVDLKYRADLAYYDQPGYATKPAP